MCFYKYGYHVSVFVFTSMDTLQTYFYKHGYSLLGFLQVRVMCELVGTFFLDKGDIYYFGRWLSMSLYNCLYQYQHFMCNLKLTLKTFENIYKHFSHIFVDFNVFFIKPAMFFFFGELHLGIY